MNVLMVVDTFIPLLAGSCTRVHGLCTHLVKEGYHVTILTLRFQKSWEKVENVDGIEVIRVNIHREGLCGYIQQTLEWSLKLAQLLITRRYDIVHVRGIPYIFHVGLLNVLLRIPLVFEIYGTIFDSGLPVNKKVFNVFNTVFQRLKLQRRINQILLKRVNKTVIICPELESYAFEWGCSKQKLVLIPNGVDVVKFSPRSKDEDIVRRYNLQNKKVLLFLGKFQRWENLPHLVEVFVKVKSELRNTKLLLVGDGPEREKVEMEIERQCIGKDIITGFIPFEDVPKYYSVCDVFVMVRPKIQIAELVSPIKPVEAMAMGKVVVSTDVGGMRGIIDDGKTGFLVSHSTDAIADKIIEVLNSPSLQEEIGANARKYVEENRDWGVIASNLVKVYEEVIHEYMQVK